MPDAAGLTTDEARARLARFGPNALTRARPRSSLHIAAEVVREPMLALLLLAGAAYFLLGDHVEALLLLVFASFSIVLTIVQEARTEHVLDALRDLSAPRALVVRDGARIRIAGCDVVPGDLVLLNEGDRVPADAILVGATELQLDESTLTGESLPVDKVAAECAAEAARVYGGTLVARGAGSAIVTATGDASEIGRIGLSLAQVEPGAPRLRLETARIVRACAVGGGVISLLVVILYGLLRGNWLNALLAGIATGMAMLPEEFSVVLTVFLAMGAWRIGQIGVLTRRAGAIETLGSATILCTDKTGTLTENRMDVARLWLPSGAMATITPGAPAPADHASLLEAGVRASAERPVDPMEQALQRLHARDAAGGTPCARLNDWVLARTLGLRPDLLAMANVWRIPPGDDRFVVAAKGAPEAICLLCRLSMDDRARILRAAETLAGDGMRVLGVARADLTQPPPGDATHADFDYRLVGLIGFADPLRPQIRGAIAQCRAAGIRVVMITGDHAATARAIAGEAGIDNGATLSGAELEGLDDAALALRLKDVTVFARIRPEQKLRIVQAFQHNGEVVAMTGDGVNDGPSLKAANIGVAMGLRGTDVAREAAAVVLLNDDFSAIVAAIRLGRRIYDNIRKAMGFIFAVHVPIAGLSLLPLVTGMPVILGPLHIALLEMIIDPVCALMFEAEREEAGLMQRPPRAADEHLFAWPMIVASVLQGGLALLICAGVFLIGSHVGFDDAQRRALTFYMLVFAIVALVLANRTFGTSALDALRRGNPIFRYILLVVASLGGLIQAVTPVRHLLGFGTLGIVEFSALAGLAVLLLLLLETVKRVADNERRASRRLPGPQRT